MSPCTCSETKTAMRQAILSSLKPKPQTLQTLNLQRDQDCKEARDIFNPNHHTLNPES